MLREPGTVDRLPEVRRCRGTARRTRRGAIMDFYALLDQVIALLRQRQRVTYRALKRQFNFDDDYLEDVKAELIQGQRLAVDEEGVVLVWTGKPGTMAPAAAPTETAAQAPLAYTPVYLAEKIVTARPTLEGERKQVTVLFADLK